MTVAGSKIAEPCTGSCARSSRVVRAAVIVLLLGAIGETERPSEFRRLFRLQIQIAIRDALRLRLIDGAIAEEARRAVTEGGR